MFGFKSVVVLNIKKGPGMSLYGGHGLYPPPPPPPPPPTVNHPGYLGGWFTEPLRVSVCRLRYKLGYMQTN